MLQVSWRMKAQNNIFAAADLADSFGGSKKTYLKKLNQSLRRKIQSQKEVPNGVYQGLENVVYLHSYRDNHRKPDNSVVFRKVEHGGLGSLRRQTVAA